MTEDEKAQAVLELLTARQWCWRDQAGMHTLTDQQILQYYWLWWSGQMYRQLRADEADEVSREACIQDFVTVHWAWEVK